MTTTIDENGQVTIPGSLRERFGLKESMEMEFVESGGQLVLRKAEEESSKLKSYEARISKWVGYLNGQPEDVDQFIEEIRGR